MDNTNYENQLTGAHDKHNIGDYEEEDTFEVLNYTTCNEE